MVANSDMDAMGNNRPLSFDMTRTAEKTENFGRYTHRQQGDLISLLDKTEFVQKKMGEQTARCSHKQFNFSK
jgi:hypothetical protein